MKLLVFCVDALDRRFFENSDRPSFQHLRKAGHWGTLRSELMLTGPCWTTILTGLTPATHGVTSVLGRPKDGSKSFMQRPADYLFDALCAAGWRCGVMNLPTILRSRPIAGWMIGGFPGPPNAQPTNLTIPPDYYCGFADYADRATARRKPGYGENWETWHFSPQEALESLRLIEQGRMGYCQELVAAYPVDGLFYYTAALDHLGHMACAWYGPNGPSKGRQKTLKGASAPEFPDVLALVDGCLESLLASFQPEFVLLASDHGFWGEEHSHQGVWALSGPDVHPMRLDAEQVDVYQTVLDAVGIPPLGAVPGREGHSVLYRTSQDNTVLRHLRSLGYEE